MKILLVGEYSGFHNNLKEGFLELGHEVLLAATADGFKKLSADILWEPKMANKLGRVLLMEKINRDVSTLKNYDIVQFINPWIADHFMGFNNMIVNKLLKNNGKSFMLVAGDDYVVWNYFKNKQTSILFNYNWVRDIIANGDEAINWNKPWIKKWSEEITQKIYGIIPIAYEYKMAYDQFSKCRDLIRMPVNVNKIQYQPNLIKNNKLVVFHGLNRESAKGTIHVRQAFEKLKDKYPNDLELIIDGQMPYHEYLKLIAKTNVVIDQTSSYSLSMNSLLSMAMGKVVLGGAEPNSIKAMGYEFCPAINITPDADDIADKVLQLLDQRDRIAELGEQSRAFIETYHHYIKIAQQYIDTYSE